MSKLLENGAYAANVLIADAIRDRMGWTRDVSAGAFIIPRELCDVFKRGSIHCNVLVVYAPNGNVGVRVSSGTEVSFVELHFVNADVCDSYGVDLIADLLLREIHSCFDEPFFFCMQRDKAELLDAIKPPMNAALVWGEGKPPPYEGGKATFYEKEKHRYATAIGNYHFEIEPTRCLDGYEIYVGDGVNRVEFPVDIQFSGDAKRMVEFLNDTPDLLVRLKLGGAT